MLQCVDGNEAQQTRETTSQGVVVNGPVLEYGRDRPPVPHFARISGWIALVSAAVFQPLALNHRFPEYASLIALALALTFGIYGIVASRGRSIPAWGAIAAIIFNCASAGLYTIH